MTTETKAKRELYLRHAAIIGGENPEDQNIATGYEKLGDIIDIDDLSDAELRQVVRDRLQQHDDDAMFIVKNDEGLRLKTFTNGFSRIYEDRK